MDQTAPDLQLIFTRALELDSPAERARYLADACGDNVDLRHEVDSLLAAYANTGNVLDDPVFSTMSVGESSLGESSLAEGPSTVIGPYKLLQQIGEGGMGVVFMAEQTHPLRRKVALKIIKPGMDSRQVIARFEAERQALAMMDHPNIAKVLDAGATGSGRPYFVMELVKGVSITEYCDQVQLTPRERLALLVPVCHAIQHAHQKGIIHRDIKPSNVLVSLYDGKPVPKVIDFGVAKAIEQRLTDRTLYTHHGVIVGTLQYMSPEQAENSALDIDTRTDVYALGVLLYELLTGTTPQRPRLKQVAYAEIVRRIREDDVPKLSTRLSKTEQLAAIAAHRGMEPAKLARLVRGELDWIAMKALEKDRSRRYASVNDLARDLQRYLADEPVEAGPPSTVYRLRKVAHRHRAALAIAGAFALVLVSATAISLWQAIRATREGFRARQSEAEAKAVQGFFRDKVLAAPRPLGLEKGLGHGVTLREALDAAEPGITADFAAQPTVEASIRDTLGATYLYLGEPAQAIPQHDRAMRLRTRALGLEHPDTLDSMNNLAVAYQADGRHTEAIALAQRALEIFTARFGPGDSKTLASKSNLANAYRRAGQLNEAIPLFKEVLALRMAKLGPEHAETLSSTLNLAAAYEDAGRIPEAIALLEPALKRFRAALRFDHPDTLTAMNSLAAAYMEAGRIDDALPLLEEVVPLRRKVLSSNHPDTLISVSNLAVAYHLLGRFDKAVPLFEEVLALRKARLSPDHRDILKTKHNLAQAYRETARTDKAIPLFEEVLEHRKVKLRDGHPDALYSMNCLAAAYLEMHRWVDAEKVLRDCLKLRVKYQPDDWRRYHTMSQLGESLAGSRRFEAAEQLLVDGYLGMKAREAEITSRFKKDLAAAASWIAPFYDAWGRPAEAAKWRQKPAPIASESVIRNQ